MAMVTRVMLRNSERSDFTDCRWRWQIAYNDRLRPLTAGMNPLVFGDIIHRGLAGWYIPEGASKKVVRGVHPAITVEKIFDKLEFEGRRGTVPVYDGDDTAWTDAKQLGISMMERYVMYFGKDDEYKVLYPEMPFQLDVYDDKGRYVCTLVGTTDCLVMSRATRKLGLLEHKTAARIETGHLFTDEQANTYWTVVPMWLRENGVIKPDDDITFMEYNFMRKAMIADDRPMNEKGLYLNSPTTTRLQQALQDAEIEYRKSGMKKDDYIALCELNGIEWVQLGEISATQPDNLFHRERVYRSDTQRRKAFTRIMQQVREMRLVRSGQLDVYKTPSKSCSWCQYRDLCEMDEAGTETDELIKFGFRHWNPYKEHVWSLDLAS